MGNLNSVTMSGNLAADPEMRDFASGSNVTHLRVALNTRRKAANGDWTNQAHFFDWAVFSGLGKWCAENLVKGDLVVVTGRAELRQWEQEGKKRSAVSFVANDVEMGTSRKSNGGAPASKPTDHGDDLPFDI